MSDVLRARGVSKSFVLHVQGGRRLDVLAGVDADVRAGDAVAVVGPSGTGKSTLLRCLYGNYGIDTGTIIVRDGERDVALETLAPHALADLRARRLGYVSQFLRVVPRIGALDVAAEPLLRLGVALRDARARIAELFARMALPERLWELSPTTFSGGEKQRVNLARALAPPYALLLLDEPTSALDPAARDRVIELLRERRAAGTALVGIYHDGEVRNALAERTIDLTRREAP